jgi:hypothetical protein
MRYGVKCERRDFVKTLLLKLIYLSDRLSLPTSCIAIHKRRTLSRTGYVQISHLGLLFLTVYAIRVVVQLRIAHRLKRMLHRLSGSSLSKPRLGIMPTSCHGQASSM